MDAAPLPLVGIPCCTRTLGGHPFHIAGDKYIRAVSEGAGALPVLIPALGPWWPVETLLDRLDGLLVTGSPSNVDPSHYGGPAAPEGTPGDAARDATTLPLIRAALARRLPVLAICRGLQELNVALGGTLSPRIHELPGRADHRADASRSIEEQYGPAHRVCMTEGGVLAGLFGRPEAIVNSVHSQGIERLAPGLAVEALADDGTIEAVRVEGQPFALAVQWHPEWRFPENADSRALLAAFGVALRAPRLRAVLDAA